MSPAACRLTLPVPGGLNHTHSVMGEAPWDGRGGEEGPKGENGEGESQRRAGGQEGWGEHQGRVPAEGRMGRQHRTISVGDRTVARTLNIANHCAPTISFHSL